MNKLIQLSKGVTIEYKGDMVDVYHTSKHYGLNCIASFEISDKDGYISTGFNTCRKYKSFTSWKKAIEKRLVESFDINYSIEL